MDKALISHQEGDQLYDELCHAFFVRSNNGKLHLAPVERPKCVLDLGCGAGVWATEFGERLSDREILWTWALKTGNCSQGVSFMSGPDVPNCQFIAADIQNEWTWLAQHKVDFIHIRGLVGFIHSWPDLLRRVHASLAPGGWLEIADLGPHTLSDDGSLSQAQGLLQFDKLSDKMLGTMGQQVGLVTRLGDMMETAGFQDVSESTRKTPLSDWSDDVEMRQMASTSAALHEMDFRMIASRGLQPVLNLSSEKVEHVLSDALHDMHNKRIHAYKLRYTFTGCKRD
ncbi:S-adenosyl-L-methionine-dependent methyltransferase [Aspergillus campestris IBT 28561]|uniref:Methyltransferase cpsF n=1 Tax=Aspergillus campestris (strain IBT 28561) TaxID=1392248 RepID=CPSF_ASPC2|nr:S-adenosyl-L-methionine-dependent methyltransferase [Aspergillus campestris IBT 28561]PKY00573.1 S-adenosyl-L-methionine-dependent methyltransferase [Aspergillus campestris IBT 28561]